MADTNNRPHARRYRKALLVLLLLALPGLPVLALIAISSARPLVQTTTSITPQDAQRLKRIFRQMEFGGYFNLPQHLLISADDINSLFALARRGIKRINGEASISPQSGTELHLSVHVPENPFGAYVNLSLGLPLSSQGMQVTFFRIGAIKMDGDRALWLFEQLADLVLGRRHSEILLNSVQGFSTHGSNIIIDYRPIPDLKRQLAELLKFAPLLNESAQNPEDVAAIRFYYSRLCETVSQDNAASLSPYLSHAFKLAQQRSHNTGQAMTENRAALLALTILFGNSHFNEVVEAVKADEIRRCQDPAAGTTLRGRVDFREHFLYSIFLKLMSDYDISVAMGELKELSDTLRGGSGFNFADLAAGQAGIHFAAYATTPAGARQVQRKAAQLADTEFYFPAMSQLAQGLSQNRFRQEYGGVDNERYRQLQDEIHSRIGDLALYHDEAPAAQ